MEVERNGYVTGCGTDDEDDVDWDEMVEAASSSSRSRRLKCARVGLCEIDMGKGEGRSKYMTQKGMWLGGEDGLKEFGKCGEPEMNEAMIGM